jgi:hypothetical protein
MSNEKPPSPAEGIEQFEQIHRELSTKVGSKIEALQGEIRRVESGENPNKGRGLGAKIELKAAQMAREWLADAKRGAQRRPGLSFHMAEDLLLDIPQGRTTLGGSPVESITFSNDGVQGLQEYFHPSTRDPFNDGRTLQYYQNPTVANLATSFLYTDQRLQSLSNMKNSMEKLKKGEKEVMGTSLPNVSIEYRRAMVAKNASLGSEAREERLQMAVVVDYLK